MMTRRMLMLAMVVLSLGGGLVAAEPDEVQSKLNGTWKPTRAYFRGMEQEGEFLDNLRFVFEKDSLTIQRAGRDRKFEWKLNTEKKPMAFTLKAIEGNDSGETARGILEITEEGVVKICMPNGPEKEGQKPPADFDVKNLPDHMGYFELKRVEE